MRRWESRRKVRGMLSMLPGLCNFVVCIWGKEAEECGNWEKFKDEVIAIFTEHSFRVWQYLRQARYGEYSLSFQMNCPVVCATPTQAAVVGSESWMARRALLGQGVQQRFLSLQVVSKSKENLLRTILARVLSHFIR
jgi:hypothetical protein